MTIPQLCEALHGLIDAEALTPAEARQIVSDTYGVSDYWAEHILATYTRSIP